MQPYFEILAECAVAFGGFSAVIAVLQGSDGARGAMRAWHTVSTSIGVFLLSLVALLVDALDVADATRWRIASVIALLWTVFSWGSVAYLDRRLGQIGEPRQFPAMLLLGYLCQFLCISILLANLVGWPAVPNGWSYGLALTLSMVGAVAGLLPSFWINVMARSRQD